MDPWIRELVKHGVEGVAVFDVMGGRILLDSLQEGVVGVPVLGDRRVAAGEVFASGFLLRKVDVLVPANHGIEVDRTGKRGIDVVDTGTHIEVSQAPGNVSLGRTAPATPAIPTVTVRIITITPLGSGLTREGSQRQDYAEGQSRSAMHRLASLGVIMNAANTRGTLILRLTCRGNPVSLRPTSGNSLTRS